MEIVSALLAFRVADVKLILMNAQVHHVIMAEFARIYRKVIDANVLLDTPVRIAKKRKVIAKPIHVQHVQCAKMNLAVEITHASAEVAIQAAIVMSLLIHAQ